MSFAWSEYLNLARSLVGQSSDRPTQEAAQRAAISRAYYAAFCEARNYLRDRENVQYIPLDGRAHFEVPDHFLQSRDAARRSVGNDLKRLRIDRNYADYYDQLPITTTIDRKVQEVLIRAARVIQALDYLS